MNLEGHDFIIEIHGTNVIIGNGGIKYFSFNLTITDKDSLGVADPEARLSVFANGSDTSAGAVYTLGSLTLDGGSYSIFSKANCAIEIWNGTTVKNAEVTLNSVGNCETVNGSLTVENSKLSVTASGNCKALSGDEITLKSGSYMTLNGVAEIGFMSSQGFNINEGASVELVPGTVLNFIYSGVLNSNGTLLNNGELKFTGDTIPTAEELAAKGITGTGTVCLGTTVYTNGGAAVKLADTDLNLETLPDSDNLSADGYSLITDASTGAKTLTLGNVRLGTVSLPTAADVTVTVTDGCSAYTEKIESFGLASLTVNGVH